MTRQRKAPPASTERGEIAEPIAKQAPSQSTALLPLDALPERADSASKADARWFRRHPERTIRLRRATAAEKPVFRSHWVVVRQLWPGVRARMAIHAADEWRERPSGDAEIAHLFDAVCAGRAVIVIGGRVYELSQMAPAGGSA